MLTSSGPTAPGRYRCRNAAFSAVCVACAAAGSGALFQSNQTFAQVRAVTGGAAGPLEGYGWAFGILMAVLTGIVIVGGITRIGRVTARLVPAMAAIYMLAGVAVLIVHADRLPAAFAAIVHGAFTGDAAYGGVLGALIVGFRRAAFSNEAGLGSAAIAHSAVRTREPLTEGFVAAWRNRMVNVHPALLPSFRGVDTHRRALKRGVKLHGATVHFVRHETDTGPIIAQAAVPVLAKDTPDTLGARVLAAEHKLLPLALRLIAEGRVTVEDDRAIVDGRTEPTVLFSPAL